MGAAFDMAYQWKSSMVERRLVIGGDQRVLDLEVGGVATCGGSEPLVGQVWSFYPFGALSS
jgi:hypothetical protein